MRSIRGWTAIVAGLAALALAVPAAAQETDALRPRHDPEKRIDRLDEMLDLTDAQEAELRSLFTERAERRGELRGDREAMRQHMRETHDRIASILTEEQREKLRALREEHRGNRPERRGERGHAPGQDRG